MSGDKVKVYHYTNRNGKEGIERTRCINPSSSGAYGAGVYLTTMSPSRGRLAVSQNNWQTSDSNGKTDFAIQLEIPRHRLRYPGSRDRDILLHPGPVPLTDYRWIVM
ncbi:uncharacterized protein LOC143292412 [Babylonia areolata]|uniref:uncharacterized protein LOC143292412 n=1 Tax=Babylonia areolata TaxID=304850 RepID=UPI003FD279CC